MKRDYIEFRDRSQAKAYFISIRCYGTWVHGDERGSVNRRSFNVIGTPKISPNTNLKRSDQAFLKNPPVTFDARRRSEVESAIREVCTTRGWTLISINVRTNHVHIVVAAGCKPEMIMNAFKSYATRRLRQLGLVGADEKIWSRHGSTRYLWTEEHVVSAVEYVVNGQGGELPRFD